MCVYVGGGVGGGKCNNKRKSGRGWGREDWGSVGWVDVNQVNVEVIVKMQKNSLHYKLSMSINIGLEDVHIFFN